MNSQNHSTFGIYKGLYWIDGSLLLFSLIAWYTIDTSFLLAFTSASILFIVAFYSAVDHWHYKIMVVGNELVEYRLFHEPLKLHIKDIEGVSCRYYGRSFAHGMIKMISLTQYFPTMPCDARLITAVHALKQGVKIDKSLVDFMSKDLREKLGFTLSATDRARLLVWRVLTAILWLTLIPVVLFMLYAILSGRV